MNLKKCAVAVLFLGLAAAEAQAQELKGSPDSMAWQYLYAERENLELFLNRKAITSALEKGVLVALDENPALEFFDFKVSAPYALPDTKQFIDWFENVRPEECGPKLVLTSGTRALDRQPANAHPLSVHLRGMSVDLRLPKNARCRQWFEKTLLSLEAQGVLDVTLETNPWHYHVAVFSFVQDGEDLLATH